MKINRLCSQILRLVWCVLLAGVISACAGSNGQGARTLSASPTLPATTTAVPTPVPSRPASTPQPTPSPTSAYYPDVNAPPIMCARCWHPALRTSWQWQLSGTVDQSYNVAMYDIDMFDNSASLVASLHARGRKVICYIDAGAWENGRPDSGKLPANSPVLGRTVEGWPNERWLDIRQLRVIGPLLQARLDQCKAKGFDGTELDLIDGYQNNTGFPLTPQDELRFARWLANQAHLRGLSVAQKGNPDQANQLVNWFDWELDEQCFEYSECQELQTYIAHGKAVMEVEYNLDPADFCSQANALNFNSLKKNLDLDAYRQACR